MSNHYYWFDFLKKHGFYCGGMPSIPKTASHVHEKLYGSHKGFPKKKAKQFLKEERKKREERKDELKKNLKGSYCYFIGNKEKEVVKIGKTTNIYKRLKSIQTGCPFDLKILGYIESKLPEETERKMHQYYRRYNLRGEWFEITDRIKSFLEELDNEVDYIF